MSATDSPLFLPETYLKMVQDILQAHLPNAEVWAYGSRVNGDYYDASDLDLVVRQPDDLMRRQVNLDEAKEAFIESNIPIIVQLVDWAYIPKSFHEEILAKYAVVQKASSDRAMCGLLLSEQVLARDWLTEEEDTAWAHLQTQKGQNHG